MELRHLRYFVAVAEELNFTRAAARLGIGQPPLSQQIRDLEAELGILLFHRVPHGAELTEAGREFLAEARGILSGAERAKEVARRAHRGEIGRLALGFTGSAAFNPLVSATIRNFRRSWPKVLLSLEEQNTFRLLERLVRGDLDAAFIRPAAQDPEGVRVRRLPDEPMLIALPASHPLAAEAALPLTALASEPFVLFPRGVGLSLYDQIVQSCRTAGFDPVIGQEAPQISSVVNLVAADLGVSIVPQSIAQIALDGVVYRPILGPAPTASLALATPRDSRSTLTRNLLSLLSG
jgi:DNA-binding transcriptional LysR family regulator